MQYDEEALTQARRQIESTVRKLRGVVSTLEGKENPARFKSQITLAKRRIEAFTLADDLIGERLAAPKPVGTGKRLWLVGGPMGVGKTAVCRAMKRMLSGCVMLDGDWCWDADPFIVTDETKAMVMRNIRRMLREFLACSAYENVVFCWVMHDQGIIDEILDGVAADVCAVSLVCDEKTLTQRLSRDIGAGLRETDVIARSIERLPLYDKLNTVRIDTTGMSIAAAARAVIAAGEDIFAQNVKNS